MKVNGVSFNVDWTQFKVGWSFFIPCFHVEEGKQEIKQVTRRLGYRVAIKVVIEEGIRGLRVWRLQ